MSLIRSLFLCLTVKRMNVVKEEPMEIISDPCSQEAIQKLPGKCLFFFLKFFIINSLDNDCSQSANKPLTLPRQLKLKIVNPVCAPSNCNIFFSLEIFWYLYYLIS